MQLFFFFSQAVSAEVCLCDCNNVCIHGLAHGNCRDICCRYKPTQNGKKIVTSALRKDNEYKMGGIGCEGCWEPCQNLVKT